MLRFPKLFFLALWLQIVFSRPAEEPTKFSLNNSIKTVENTVNENEKHEASRIQKGMEFLGGIMDQVRFGRGRLVNSLILARNNIFDRSEDWLGQMSDATKLETGKLVNSALVARNNFTNQPEDNIGAAQNSVTSVILTGNEDHTQATLQSYEKAQFTNLLTPNTRETVRLESESGQALFERKKPNPIGGILENILQPTPIVDGIKEEQKYGNSGDKFIGIGRALVNGFEGLSNVLNALVDFPIKAAKQTSRGLTETLNQLGARLIGLQ